MSKYSYTYVPPIPIHGSIVYIPRQPNWDGSEWGGFFEDTADPRRHVRVPLAEWPDELLCQQEEAYKRAIEQRQGEIIQPKGGYVGEEWYDYEDITAAKCRNEAEISRLNNMLRKIKAEIRRRWLAAQEMMAEDAGDVEY